MGAVIAFILSWLNPMNLIKLLSLIKALYSGISEAIALVSSWILKRNQQKEIDQINQAEQQMDQANQTEDDAERLKEKADAACKMEQVFDPNRKC